MKDAVNELLILMEDEPKIARVFGTSQAVEANIYNGVSNRQFCQQISGEEATSTSNRPRKEKVCTYLAKLNYNNLIFLLHCSIHLLYLNTALNRVLVIFEPRCYIMSSMNLCECM